MYEVSVEATFSAGHALRNYKGKCENVHGHNYRVQVTIEGEQVSPTNGLLVDFADVKKVLRTAIAYMDHQFINDLPPFDIINPSAENMAKWFWDEMQKGLNNNGEVAKVPFRVQAVKVWETDTSVAVYRP
jgi:6-pyruvoyltetrahydropterin/6-carboxytetrahydropterin synthase